MVRTLVQQCNRFYWRPAVTVAAHLFAPRGLYLSPDEPVLNGFSIIRGTVGVLILFVVSATYGTDLGGVEQFPLVPPLLADPKTVLAAPFVIVMLAVATVCFTRRGYRRRVARQLVYPIQTSILYVALVVASGWILLPHYGNDTGIAAVLVHLLAVLAVPWFVIVLLCGGWWCAAGLFRAADGHPLLAPVAATVFAWLAASRALHFGTIPATMPHTLYFTVLLGGPTTVTALSAFEIWQLHRNPGFPFREGPPPRSRGEAPWAGVPLSVFLHDQITKFRHQWT
jgi:hypothetical protein